MKHNLKRNELLLHVSTQMNLKGTILKENNLYFLYFEIIINHVISLFPVLPPILLSTPPGSRSNPWPLVSIPASTVCCFDAGLVL